MPEVRVFGDGDRPEGAREEGDGRAGVMGMSGNARMIRRTAGAATAL